MSPCEIEGCREVNAKSYRCDSAQCRMDLCDRHGLALVRHEMRWAEQDRRDLQGEFREIDGELIDLRREVQ